MANGDDIQMLYVSGDGVFSSVMDSQVVMPFKALASRHDMKCSLLILTSVRHWRKRATAERMQNVREQLAGLNVQLRFRLPMGSRFARQSWSWQIGRAMRRAGFDRTRPVVIHCRGMLAAAPVLLLKPRNPHLRVLLDMRGDPVDEIKVLTGRRARKSRIWTDQGNAMGFAAADGMTAVSSKLLENLRAAFPITRGLPSAVVPCCVDPERFFYDPQLRARRRSELNLADKFVVSYCGSGAWYQRLDVVAAFFAAVASEMPDAHFLALSGDSNPIKQALRQAGVPLERATFANAKHSEVASYLMAGDVGLLLREDLPTNRAASPVKFPEYLRCGLPVILTPYVGDYGEMAPAAGVGLTVDLPLQASQTVAAVRRIRERQQREGEACRRHCSDWAARNFSWESRIAGYVELYQKLSKGAAEC